jgi:surface antigen
LSREAQACGRVAWPGLRTLVRPLPFVAAILLAACASRGVDIEAAVDDTITTAAIPAAPAAASDPLKISDEATIRNAVSSADLEAVSETGISWANTDSGSRGAITALAEYKRKGQLCRRFEASRESYDGVGLYAGETCRTSDGAWRMLKFKEN